VNKALWDESETVLSFNSYGPGSSINKTGVLAEQNQVKSISIDDFVTQNNLPKVDFIKLDIEGSECWALRGAINTIRKFKPQLAITIYHGKSDFIDVPVLLKELDLGYEFHLNHFTIYQEETVLFATV
jgi:hypothetical protein